MLGLKWCFNETGKPDYNLLKTLFPAMSSEFLAVLSGLRQLQIAADQKLRNDYEQHPQLALHPKASETVASSSKLTETSNTAKTSQHSGTSNPTDTSLNPIRQIIHQWEEGQFPASTYERAQLVQCAYQIVTDRPKPSTVLLRHISAFLELGGGKPSDYDLWNREMKENETRM